MCFGKPYIGCSYHVQRFFLGKRILGVMKLISITNQTSHERGNDAEWMMIEIHPMISSQTSAMNLIVLEHMIGISLMFRLQLRCSLDLDLLQ